MLNNLVDPKRTYTCKIRDRDRQIHQTLSAITLVLVASRSTNTGRATFKFFFPFGSLHAIETVQCFSFTRFIIAARKNISVRIEFTSEKMSKSPSVVLLSRLAFLLVLLMIQQSVLVVQAGLRDGFSSKVGSDAKNRMKLDDAGAAAGLSREVYLMKDKRWEIQPADFSTIDDLKLRRQCEKYLSKPVTMKLSTRRGKYGMRAVGDLQNGKRLRGFWRQAPGSGTMTQGSDFLKLKYADAVKQRLTTVEFELQLPPTDRKSKTLPAVIYSIAVEPGAMNQKAIVPRGGGSVRILPKGHGDGDKAQTMEVGKAYVSIPMRSGLVDPGWAKGRMAFRRGRSTGPV
jgi:hypothetical protein